MNYKSRLVDLSNGVCWALIFSVASNIMSIVALAHSNPRDSRLGFDYLAVIVGILALLVTFLVGWQIYTTIITREQVKEMGRRIAKAKEEAGKAKEIARKEIKKEIGSYNKTLSNITIASIGVVSGEYAKTIALSKNGIGQNGQTFPNAYYSHLTAVELLLRAELGELRALFEYSFACLGECLSHMEGLNPSTSTRFNPQQLQLCDETFQRIISKHSCRLSYSEHMTLHKYRERRHKLGMPPPPPNP